MRISDLNPKSKIRIGIILIVMIVLLQGGFALVQMEKLSQLTNDMYNHPLAVSKALLGVESHINAIHRTMKDVILSETPETIEATLSVLETQENHINKEFTILFEKFLGDPKQVHYAYSLVLESKSIRDEVIALCMNGSYQAASEILSGRGESQFNRIFEALEPMVDFASDKAKQFLDESQAQQTASMTWLVISIILFSGAAYFVLISTIRTYKSSEQKYTNLIHNMREGVTIGTAEGELLYVNPSYATMLGYSHPKELIGTQAIDVYANPGERKTIFEKLMVDGFIDNMEIDLIKKDKSLAHVLVSIFAKRDDAGQVIEIESIVLDITERERTEAMLQHQQELIKTSARLTKIGGFEINLVTGEHRWTRETFLVYGLDPEGQPPPVEDSIKFYPPEARIVIQNLVDEAIEKHKPYDVELPLISARGESRWVRTLGQVEVEDGKAIRLFGAIQDITERKNAEKVMLSEKLFSKSLVSSLPGVFYLISEEGRFLRWNTNFETVTGRSAEEMMQISPVDLFDGEDKQVIASAIKRVFIQGEEQAEGQIVAKDGQRTPYQFTGKKIIVDGEPCLVGLGIDITESKQVEVEKENALLEAKNANEVKDQFIANISHEIRTPLNSILGFSDLFKQRYVDNIEEKDRIIFDHISESSERLMHTVDSILNMSMLKSGIITVHKEVVNMNEVIAIIVNNFKVQADKKNIAMELIESDIAAEVFVDLNCINSAIDNLADNALKYTKEGSVRFTLELVEEQLTLSIRDTGIGISDEYIKRIFEPYTQESEGFTKAYQGVGLGLALTKQFLDLNDVALEVESQKNIGTTFKLTFPKFEAEDDE